MPSFQVASCRRSIVADSALWEDFGGDNIAQCLRHKHNNDRFLTKSPVVIELVDSDDL